MKYVKLKTASAACGLSLLLAASNVLADPLAIATTPGGTNQTVLTGSDTLNEVMDSAVKSLGPVVSGGNGTLSQLVTYNGQGSSAGQRQLEGIQAADEPTCSPVDTNGAPESNPGCQEIAPMSRLMNSTICEDEVSSGSNATAEHLAICGDGLVVIADNKAFAQFGTGACSTGTSPNEPADPANLFAMNAGYSNSGKLRSGGTLPVTDPNTGANYKIGANSVTGWKDVLRVVYTGCLNSYSDKTCATISRATRCDGTSNPVRKQLIDHWDWLVNSGAIGADATSPAYAGDTDADCNGATANQCAGGLRAAYRRDDASGTTGVFLSMLSLGATLTQRTALVDTSNPLSPKIVAASDTHLFCDGGDNEGYLKSTTTGGIGDPITKPCLAEDDLCIGASGAGVMGVVRPMRSTLLDPGVNATNYPIYQCTVGKFQLMPYINVALPICPDGIKPIAGKCLLPYYEEKSGSTVIAKHFDCINPAGSKTGLANVDGRVYNFVMRDDAGNVRFRDGTTKKWPDAAQWRQNMRNLSTDPFSKGGPWASLATTAHPEWGQAVCQEQNATKTIGCVVGNTTCTIGFAGREAAQTDPYDDLQEPFYINGTNAEQLLPGGYVMFRDLYLSAIGGFENLKADCVARSPSGQEGYCNDEVALTKEFYKMGSFAVNACKNAGFVPKKAVGVDPALDATRCVGAMATGSSGCGAPAVQPLTACDPFCGDSNVDTDMGEQCDDGNRTNGDGCNSSCLTE